MRNPRFAILSAFLGLNLILLGALLFDTAILYPDQFHDIPRSLAASNAFMAVTGTADFMRPVGMATVLLDVVALVAAWRSRAARTWVAVALVVLVAANFVFSALYFWPANHVMFVEGPALHPVAELEAVARGFIGWNVVRILGCLVAAGAAFVAFVRFHAEQVAARTLAGRNAATELLPTA